MLRILSLPPGALDMLNEMQLLRLSRTVRGMYKGGKVSCISLKLAQQTKGLTRSPLSREFVRVLLFLSSPCSFVCLCAELALSWVRGTRPGA
ncbi:hypothetical protein KC319_g16 [Hortaea werneckii]|nr:hypothetical protein KC319_g16 [Hortaea werneckii]